MLEPYEVKVSRTVLRRERGSNPSDLADVEVQVYPEKQEAEPLSFQNDYLGIYQQVYDDGKCNVRLKKDIAIFVDDWLSNIINCEYKLIEKED